MEEIISRKEYKLGDLTEENMQYEPEPLFDEYGNPTPHLLQAFWEDEHGEIEFMTLEDFKAELDEIRRSIKSI
ncbi:MAG: hypothetical protein IJP96_09040 [Synergistaceae bacterium]|nr:hypothetical protein [Synergistaceae bacterium]MBR0075883.1 hypothetical protein [Synergistaceae bacterium]